MSRKRVFDGTPYIGWSAGSNVACPTIMTTNDMPVVEPDSFNAFNLIPFQINPHYLDANPAGHAGETREQRIEEFIEVNPDVYVVGLREGTMLLVENRKMNLIGPRKARIFRKGICSFRNGMQKMIFPSFSGTEPDIHSNKLTLSTVIRRL